MICEVYLLNAAVEELTHFCISPPKDSVAKCGNALLFAGIVDFCAQVVLVCRFKVYWALLKLVKE